MSPVFRKPCLALSLLMLALTVPASAGATTSFLITAETDLPADLEEQIAAAGGTLFRVHPEIGVAVARSENPYFAQDLGLRGDFSSVVPDATVRKRTSPELLRLAGAQSFSAGGPAHSHGSVPDPEAASLYACQWSHPAMNTPGAWSQGVFGHPRVKVAVLETGIDPTHQDLVGRVDLENSASVLTPGTSPCNPDLPDEETFLDFHVDGTLNASQISSNNIGIASVAPKAKLVAIKVFNCTATGNFTDVVAGILYAARLRDVEVINLSLSFYVERSPENQPLIHAFRRAVRYASWRGKLVVAEAGDNGTDLDNDGNMIVVPAELPGAMSVYATGNDDSVPPISNFGRTGTWVGAPGGILPNAQPPLPGCGSPPPLQSAILGACSTTQTVLPFPCAPDTYVIGISTGISAAYASGVAALVDGQAYGWLPPFLLKLWLAATADDLGDPGTDPIFSRGRINAGRAVSFFKDGPQTNGPLPRDGGSQ